jgi:flagella basal body P-ring formation protein FlgA
MTLCRIFLSLAFGGAVLLPLPCLAGQTVNLRDALSSEGSQVTFGDLFDNAGTASDVVVATRNQPSATLFLDASAVQRLAAQYGLSWDNGTGMRRLVVRPQGLANPAPSGAGPQDERSRGVRAHQSAQRRDMAEPTIIQKGDLVQVSYRDQGMVVSIQGRAMSAAAAGQTFPVLNTGSKRTLDAVAVAPGQAAIGPGLDRPSSDLNASRRIVLAP